MLSRQLMYCMCADKQFAQGTFFEDYHVVHFLCKSYLSQHYSVYHIVVYLAVALFDGLVNHVNIARPNVHHPGSKHWSPSIPHSQ